MVSGRPVKVTVDVTFRRERGTFPQSYIIQQSKPTKNKIIYIRTFLNLSKTCSGH